MNNNYRTHNDPPQGFSTWDAWDTYMKQVDSAWNSKNPSHSFTEQERKEAHDRLMQSHVKALPDHLMD